MTIPAAMDDIAFDQDFIDHNKMLTMPKGESPENAELSKLRKELLELKMENLELVKELNKVKGGGDDKGRLGLPSSKFAKKLEKTRKILAARAGSPLPFPRLRNRIAEANTESDLRLTAEEAQKEEEWVSLETQEDSDAIDVAKEVICDDDIDQSLEEDLLKSTCGWFERIQNDFYLKIFNFLSDFADDEEDSEEEDESGEALKIRNLKRNISRFGAVSKPMLAKVEEFSGVNKWESPATTFLWFLVYMYCMYNGWFFSVFFLFLVVQLTVNYVNYKPWVPRCKEEEEDEDSDGDSAVGEKLQTVMDIARRVQNSVGKLADNLERLKNLVTWHEFEATKQLYLRLWLAFLISCFIKNSWLVSFAGLAVGFKTFILDYVFFKFPRVKKKYSNVSRMWNALPTDHDLDHRETIDKYILPKSDLELGQPQSLSMRNLTQTNKEFCELFDLPPTEHPRPAWAGGKLASLVNRSKGTLNIFKHGKLYLTRSFLCFERTKKKEGSFGKNVVIPLQDIRSLEKCKLTEWFPGNGMALRIHTADKVFLFAGIYHRDACFESINRAGQQWQLAWSEPPQPQETTAEAAISAVSAASATTSSTAASAPEEFEGEGIISEESSKKSQ